MNPLKELLPQPTNEEKSKAVKKAWDDKFGETAAIRTPKQWKALVDQYGENIVCKMQNMTIKQLKKKFKHA